MNLDNTVTHLNPKALERRMLRAKILAKRMPVEVPILWLQLKREELRSHRKLLEVLDGGSVSDIAQMVTATCKLRAQMLEISGLPRRPGSGMKEKPTIPALAVEEIGLNLDPKPGENPENVGENTANPGDSKSAGVPPVPEITPELPPDLPE